MHIGVMRDKVLVLALVLSAAFNVGFVAKFFLDLKPAPIASFRVSPKSTPTTAYLDTLFQKSFFELVEELANTEPVQDGYRKNELALATLVALHSFDVSRVISREPGRKVMQFSHKDGGEVFQLALFPDMTPEEMGMLSSFAKREKWPFTLEGIFARIPLAGVEEKKELLQIVLVSKEWNTVRRAMQRFIPKLAMKDLFSYFLDRRSDALRLLYKELRESGKNEAEAIRYFFLKAEGLTRPLLQAWIAQDMSYLLHDLSDEELVSLLQQFSERSDEVVRFLQLVFASSRRDFVREAAAERLSFFEGALVGAISLEPPPMHEARVRYTVQQGDSLWKIAKKFHLSIEELKQKGGINSEKLRPGQEIVIQE